MLSYQNLQLSCLRIGSEFWSQFCQRAAGDSEFCPIASFFFFFVAQAHTVILAAESVEQHVSHVAV